MSPLPLFREFAAAFFAVSALALVHQPADAVAAPAASSTCCPADVSTPAPVAGVRHVVLIGVDGFGAYAWEKAKIPNLRFLAANGALTLNARTVLPTISAPNWGTHLMGAGPELHGWTSNGARSLEPLVRNERGLFPTVFSIVRAAHPKAKLAAFYDWGRIHNLLDTDVLSHEVYVGCLDGKITRFKRPREHPRAANAGDSPRGVKRTDQELVEEYEASSKEVTAAAAEYIEKEKPLLSFIYLGALDETGHKLGHDTPAYYTTLANVDAHVGRILEAIKKAGMEKETVIIVVSDHGGVGRGHGKNSKLETQIPWLIWGPGIKRGVTMNSAVLNTDTSPTIVRLLGLPQPQPWRGKPVEEAIAK
ncbi:MAG: alkaline phosphatase [Puniceicoccales bacterium]|nr:alkaline phosphatase [Puniceicoccales bacterium]